MFLFTVSKIRRRRRRNFEEKKLVNKAKTLISCEFVGKTENEEMLKKKRGELL